MKTYVLYDKATKLYKIGRTSNPVQRFSKLCTRGIVPMLLLEGDLEKELHTQFSANRVSHPEEVDGRTEYFRRGGKIDTGFNTFADAVDIAEELPYLSVTKLIGEMIRKGKLVLDDPLLVLETDKRFAQHDIGLGILISLGIIQRHPDGTLHSTSPHILTYARTFLISRKLYDNIYNKSVIRISATKGEGAFRAGNLYITINR